MKPGLLPLLIILLISIPVSTLAQWQPNGTPVTADQFGQEIPIAVPDGAGGAIIVWRDLRVGVNYDVYAQRLDATGAAKWTPNGVAICTANYNQIANDVIPDGSGGAIIVWDDFRNGVDANIYTQRIDAAGAAQWTTDGVAICTAAYAQNDPTLISDGGGGAIIAWQDFRSQTSYDIYAQRINASGVLQWAADGVVVSDATNYQYNPAIASDGAGGAVVSWEDYRGGVNWDIYAQRVNASGVMQWTVNGVALCTALNAQTYLKIVPDGSSGAIATWKDARNGNIEDIYAQRVTASGSPAWGSNGVAICTAAYSQDRPQLVSDGVGGAVITWADFRNNSNWDIYAQRINASGLVEWTSNGVALCTAAYEQAYPAIASDEAGGAVIAWYDVRSGSNQDIYVQHINSSGAVQWQANGTPLCTAAGNQYGATITSDTGGVIVAWHDYRGGGWGDIYAQRIETAEGYVGHPEPFITAAGDNPGDQGGKVKVNWKASDQDVRNNNLITHYSVWRATDAVAFASATVARGVSVVNDLSRVGPDFAGPAVRLETDTAGNSYYWEWVGNQGILYAAGYSMSVPTRNDSTSQDAGVHYFQVASHTSDPFLFWTSNVMSGYSVDNLAPAAPLMLTAQRVGDDVCLKWNRVHISDLRNYSVYRATSSGVTPVSGNLLGDTGDSLLVDTGAPLVTLYYVVTARDIHENQSDPSNEAMVTGPTGVGDTPAITQLTVLPNTPNPFSAETELRIGLPVPSDVTVEIYDVAGRRVGGMVVHDVASGWRNIPFTGRDDRGAALASGVYFYRVTTHGATVTRKMVIAR